MGLLGTIPPSIGNLSFLVSLDLSKNNFSGCIPKEMARLRRIKDINLDFNDLSGGLPTRKDDLVLRAKPYHGLVLQQYGGMHLTFTDTHLKSPNA
ncbi:hypothetical protein RJ640_023926 [Escallonia rubra]|uniref:Uncharacterized protein n=1 Tax=Escallonia rubra TaxID=112253 RepID=A0AA88QWC7_9ASTE|nr:hypothetical protein RJ640_023926 [Escallonia rubra]